MSTSKKTLSARLQRKTWLLSEKIKLFDYKKSNPTIGCRDIAETLKIVKTSAATIIKNKEKLRKDYASFEDNRKQIRRRKFNKLNEAMYLWNTKCCVANLHPTGALIQEEALLMKEKMIKTNPELDGFHASNRWLESFKTTYGIRETTTVISGEAGDVPITTAVKAWMERLPELAKDYLWLFICAKYGWTRVVF